MKTEVIHIRCKHKPPFEPEEYDAPIRAEIYGPFAVHVACRTAKEGFSVTMISHGKTVHSDSFPTIEEARRVAKRLQKMNIDWGEVMGLMASGRLDSTWWYRMIHAVTDEGFKVASLRKEFFRKEIINV